jgi:predicted GNAT family N-acyltransferase
MKEVNMLMKEYDYLSEDAIMIRNEVFVKEQGFNEEFDEIDGKATHIVMYDRERAISTCRIYYHIEKLSFVVGRIAVIKAYRGKNIGAKMLRYVENNIRKNGGKNVVLSAQVRVAEFYEKQGYKKSGEVYLDEDCPHIWMEKKLKIVDV